MKMFGNEIKLISGKYIARIFDGKCTIVNAEKIKKIDDSSFKNEKGIEEIELPINIREIEASAFENCLNLKLIKLPDNLTIIGPHAFKNCLNLFNIEFPANLRHIKKSAFSGCKNLQSIKLPNNLLKIENDVFFGCEQLKEVTLPDNLNLIGAEAFCNCKSLEEVKLPNTVRVIGRGAFKNCSNLNKIYFNNNLKTIYSEAFANCENLREVHLSKNTEAIYENAFDSLDLVTIGDVEEEFLNNQDYIFTYLYNNLTFVNSLINKNGIYDINNFKIELLNSLKISEDDFLSCFIGPKYGAKSVISETVISDFKERLELIYKKTRFREMIDFDILMHFDIENLKNFDLKIWNKYKDNALFKNNEKELIEAISLFGLFVKDENFNSRINKFDELFVNDQKYLSTNNYELIIENNINSEEFINKLNSEIEREVNKEYNIINGKKIPNEYNNYLKPTLTNKQWKAIKKMNGTFGKKINNFIDENYKETEKEIFLIKNGPYNEEIVNYIQKNNLNEGINVEDIKYMFNNIKQEYNPNLADFIYNNFSLITLSKKNEKHVNKFVENYDKINKYYLSKGNYDYNYIDVLQYLKDTKFKNIEIGNEEFAALVKNAGVSSQEAFEYYQEKYQQMRKREVTAIPRYNESFEIKTNKKTYKLKAKILDLKDPFTLLVGEKNYTNCCQVLGGYGEECMEHAAEDGGIFCVYIEENGIDVLLAQSWVWVNGNLFCFDNVEITKKAKQNKLYEYLTVCAYKKAGDYLVNGSKEQLKYNLDKMDLSSYEKEEIYDNQNIKAVTIGVNNDKLNCYDYFSESKIRLSPSFYDGYRDSYTQVLISSDASDYSKINHDLEYEYLIYREPRVLKYEDEIYSELQREIKDVNPNTNVSNFENYKLVISNDFYIIYEENEGIDIIELYKGAPRIKDEKSVQNEDLLNALIYVFEKALVNEDTQEFKPINGIKENVLEYVKEQTIKNINNNKNMQNVK